MTEEQTYPHIRFKRVDQVNPRRTRRGRGPSKPENIAVHAERLEHRLEEREADRDEEPGFDPRLLLKLQVQDLANPSELEKIEGLTVVSQEDKTVTVLFATREGIAEFKRRLRQLRAHEQPVNKELLYAIIDVDHWSREDRTGLALRVEGAPETDRFYVDVELWWRPKNERTSMLEAFNEWCRDHDAKIVDHVEHDSLVLLRVDATATTLERLLLHRDVRQVDLPPRYQMDVSLFGVPLPDLGEVDSPPDGAPPIAVLDSGIVSGHPLLAPAVGEAASFVEGLDPADENGHGTLVAGLALYGDVQACVESRDFAPQLRLLSGRITDADAEAESTLVENRIIAAVEYFTDAYQCRVFNLSFGDRRRPYRGSHVDRLAAVLDSLARTHRVLFVVSAGNFEGDTSGGPSDWRAEYPDYLLSADARLLDPAPALNVLTVGSLARHDVSRGAARNPTDPASQPIARRDWPSPFTRSGPGPLGSIKPEVVDYGGNWAVDTRQSPPTVINQRELGELSTSVDFAGGRLFTRDAGTSFAAPRVAWMAASLLRQYPHASPDLLRALIVAHARLPSSVGGTMDEQAALRLMGYGRPELDPSRFSTDRRVSLIAEDEIEADRHHFYEIPIPADFLSAPAKRRRRLTVALAYTPSVRRTRYDYRESALAFRLVKARSLDEVELAFKHGSKEKLPDEQQRFRPTPTQREGGTLQAATWDIQTVSKNWMDKPPFLVVTHQPRPWTKGLPLDPQPYAVVVVVEDLSEQRVQLYAQIQQQVRQRQRGRVVVPA